MKRVIVTGATGMIGWNLIEYLVKQHIYVLALINPNSKRKKRLHAGPYLKIVECSLCDFATLPSYGQYDGMFHLGWEGTYGKQRDDFELQLNNVRYALEAVRYAKRSGCEVFVGAGSQAEYGVLQGTSKLSATTFANPSTGYGIGKLTAGLMTRELCEQLQIRHIWTRILSVYGPGDGAHTMVMSGIQSMLEGKQPQYTSAEQQWDYLYVKDAVKALYMLAKNGVDKKIYCLGSGKTRMLKEYIMEIRDVVAPGIEPMLGAIPYTEKQVMYLCADISELTMDTGFVPEYDFKTGIEETVMWYRRENTNEKD